jgi:GT2 family glycosyltransferase
MIDNPLVSVIVLNWNGAAFLRGCLESVMKSRYPRREHIVIDNGSTDDSQRILQEIQQENPGIRCIYNKENLGYAGGNNVGAEMASGKYLVFLNVDTVVAADWLTHLVELMESNDGIGACQPMLLLMDDPTRLDVVGAYLTPLGFLKEVGNEEVLRAEFLEPREIFSAKGACLMVRRDIFEAAGGFDTDFFFYGEETDLCWRIWLLGYAVRYVPSAVVYHKSAYTDDVLSPTRRIRLKKFFAYRNRLLYLYKNLSSVNLARMLPVHLALCIVAVFVLALRGRKLEAKAITNAIGSFMVVWPRFAARRASIQRGREMTDRDIFRRVGAAVDLHYFLALLTG